MIQQSNPILYIMLGEEAPSFLRELKRVITELIGPHGAGFLPMIVPSVTGSSSTGAQVTEEPSAEWMKEQINELQQFFMKKHYLSRGILRVNYILTADDPAGLKLPSVRALAEYYLQLLYPAGLLTDFYLLLNDADVFAGNIPTRRKLITLLHDEQANGNLVYLLSNVNSLNMHDQESMDNILDSISLLALFKDCRPPTSTVYTANLDASRYKEQYFSDNCYHNGGRFLTAGRYEVSIPSASVRAILISSLLNYGREQYAHDPVVDLFTKTEDNPYTGDTALNDLYGMGIPDIRPNEYIGLTRRQIISQLFGSRLDKFFEMRQPKTDNLDEVEVLATQLIRTVETLDAHFYDLLRRTSPTGVWQKQLTAWLNQNTDALFTAESRLEQWMSGKPEYKQELSEKRRLSPFYQHDSWPYTLAAAYLKQLFDIRRLNNQNELISRLSEHVTAYYQRLEAYLPVIDEAIAGYKPDIMALNDALSAFTTNAAAYYKDQFNYFATKYSEAVKTLTAPLTECLREDRFDDYLSRLENFVDTKLMASRSYNRPIMDTLSDLYARERPMGAKTALFNHLGELIVRHKQFNIFLKTGYTNLYSETNILMHGNGADWVKRHNDTHSHDKSNLFIYEGAKRILVLYHAGAFNTEDLYYRDLYI